ncbi:MAG: electron transport complex subunit RsxC, partial [Candidatus Delongbacteria bacterium]|nr:electron transport complex subunit RsxC [Candidatus Delongbacteria bacterium]
TMPSPATVFIPLVQHIGAPAHEVVGIGDTVKKGQKIGEISAFVSANIHASINGTVKAITQHISPTGNKVKTVVIESDHSEEEAEQVPAPAGALPDGKKMLDQIKECGLAGMGGASFPTHIKLSPPQDKQIDHLIINAAECEPYLTCDYRLMMEKTEELIRGIEIFKTILNVKHASIGIEKNKPLAIAAVKKAVHNHGIEVIDLEVKYPQGAEKQLIYAVTRREVPRSGLPMDVGVVVQNVGTALAAYEAVMMNKGLYERVLTVSGPGIKQPKNLRVRIGTPIQAVIDYCGGLIGTTQKIINGGPMMGITLYDLNAPVIKGTSGIVVLTDRETSVYNEQPCISCAHCVDACPMRLIPTGIIKNTRREFWEEAERFGAMDCIECGSCAFVCPAKINLIHTIRLAKSEITKRRRAAAQKQGAPHGK